MARGLYESFGTITYPGFREYYSIVDFRQKKHINNLVYVGQMTPQKGVYHLIKFIEAYNHKFIDDILTLTIFTKHTRLDTYENDFVKIKKNVDYKDIRDALSHYDAAVFPSIWNEPFGFVMAEYVDAGLPVLTSGRGGSAELYAESDLYFFDPECFVSFEKAIAAIRSENSVRRLELTKNNKAKLSQLSWSHLLDA